MNPKISVIIAAYNEEKLLPRCLEALQKQSYPKEQFEVIVVDNGSKDKTKEIARRYGAHVYTYTDIQGCGASRKFGVLHAKGDIIAFTDADAAVFPDWLEKIEAAFSDAQIVFVGGPAYPDTKNIWNITIFKVYHGFDLIHSYIHKPLMGGYNMAVKKEAYDASGGINSSLKSSDDWDLSLSLTKHFGYKRVRFSFGMKVFVSTRKQNTAPVFFRYLKDQIITYINMVLLGRSTASSLFTIR